MIYESCVSIQDYNWMTANSSSQFEILPGSLPEKEERTWPKLLLGASGIYVSLLISALFNEKILKQQYKSLDANGTSATFSYPIIFLLVPSMMGFLIGKSFNSFEKEIPHVPRFNLLKMAMTILISGLSFNAAILYLEFPIVVLIKSCNILPVILVGVFCSRVKAQSNQKLGKEKLCVGIVVSVGVMIFFSGNQTNPTSTANPVDTKNPNSAIGFCLLAVSILADGFLPDFQAEVKQKYNPGPMILYQKTNLYVFLLSLTYVIATKQIVSIISFMQTYPSVVLDVLSESVMACIGQVFVYYIVFNFQQHVAPFILTSRKVISAIVSIMIFNHPVNIWQCIGISLVILGVILQLTLKRVIKVYREVMKYKNYDVI